ncbi:hypothetical protein ELBI_17 [Anabaena phage Elbi]|nr:hypothetical protein ELBI_17 [Anabaena phage Elbi]
MPYFSKAVKRLNLLAVTYTAKRWFQSYRHIAIYQKCSCSSFYGCLTDGWFFESSIVSSNRSPNLSVVLLGFSNQTEVLG